MLLEPENLIIMQMTKSIYLLLLVFFLLVSACTSSLMDGTYKSISSAVKGVEYDIDFSRSDIEKTPFAKIKITHPYGTSLLVLNHVIDKQEYWLAKSGSFLVLKDGLIIKTYGLDNDLTQLIEIDSPFANGLHINDAGKSYKKLFSFEGNPSRFNLEATANLVFSGKEKVRILDSSYELFHFVESVEIPSIAGVFENEYWADPETGFIFKSVQFIGNDYMLSIEQVKPFFGI